MQRSGEQILRMRMGLPEGTSVSAEALLHLGMHAAVDRAVSPLAERGDLIRASRGPNGEAQRMPSAS